MGKKKTKFGRIFSLKGTKYIEYDGGAILLEHAIQKLKESGKDWFKELTRLIAGR